MVDFDTRIDGMDDDELLAYQQELTRTRLEAIEAGRRVQTELDRRAAQRAEQRAEQDRRLGAESKPPAQNVFGDPSAGFRKDRGDDGR